MGTDDGNTPESIGDNIQGQNNLTEVNQKIEQRKRATRNE